MDVFFGAALGFLVLATLGGGVFLAFRAWRAWQAFVSLAAGGAAGVEGLFERVEQLAAHAERTSARAAEATAAAMRLQRSLARAQVLTGAVGDMRDTIRAVLAFVPH